MAIETVDGLIKALGNDNSPFIIDKASIANAVAGQQFSLWRATGQPAQAAIPVAAAIPTGATLGAMPLTNQTAPRFPYLGFLYLNSSLTTMSPEIHDRVAQGIGNGSFVSIVSQTTIAVDVLTLGLVAARRGAANYSDLQWWLEVYTDGGATASNATVNVTYNDATTGNLNVIAVGGTLRAGRMISLTAFIPTADQGKFIRGINSVINSASTTVAGAFGFTCTRLMAPAPLIVANATVKFSWEELGQPLTPNDACLFIIMLTSTTSTGTLKGGGKIAYG